MGRTRIEVIGLPTTDNEQLRLSYRIVRPKEVIETIELVGTISDDTIFLPDHKSDALAFAGIADAIQYIIGQAIRDDLAHYRTELASYNKSLKAATDSGDAKAVIGLLKSKPEKPELSDACTDLIEPWVEWFEVLSDAWKAAKKHTLSVYGTGSDKGNVVWTGTLSSLIGRKPAKGAIALGRRVR